MPTLVQYRRFAAPEAGRYTQGTADASGASTTTMVAAPLKSSISQNDLYVDYWLYIPAGSANDKVRVVASYAASTGIVTVDRAVSAAGVYNSKVFELHGAVRPFADDLTEILDWTIAINDALKRCYVEAEFTVTPTAQATRHSLTAGQAWLTEPRWVKQVGSLITGETRANQDPYRHREPRWEAYAQANVVYLYSPNRTYNSNETIYVRCAKPAYYNCRASGGVFGDQSGLALETDEAEPSVEYAGFGALVEVARRSTQMLSRESMERALSQEQRWAALFANYAGLAMGSIPLRNIQPMRVRVR